MEFYEALPGLEEATSYRELLTDEVKEIYFKADSLTRAEMEEALREIATKGKFKKAFDNVFSAFKKMVKDQDRELETWEREQYKADHADENRIDLRDNPYDWLRSYTYKVDETGVYLGDACICSQPVLIIGKLRNIENKEESLRIVYCDGSSQEQNDATLTGKAWREMTVKRETLFNSSKIVQLSAYGLAVHSANAREVIKYLDTLERENQLVLFVKSAVSRLGWFPGGLFSPYSSSIVFDGENENRELFEAVKAVGDFEVWREHVQELRKNLCLRMTMAASLAAPLIDRAHALPFIFHLWGGSGTGKTVALMVAMSIWGDPANGKLTRTMNATKNAMMNAAAFFHSLPVAFDELQIAKLATNNFSSIDSLVMLLTEGTDRGRMKGHEAQAVREWKCCFIMTGEEPIVKASSGGGVFNRVIEAECYGPVVGDGNQTVSVIRANHGHAGKIFIDHIVERDVSALFNEQNRALLQNEQTTDKQAASMALLMVADRLAGECLFPGEAPLTICDVLPFLKSQKEVDDAERAYEYICGMIAANVTRFADVDGQPWPSSGETWGRFDGAVCTINKVKLDELLRDNGQSFDAVKKKWAERGYLLRDPGGKLAHRTSIGGVKARFVKLVLGREEHGSTTTEDDELIL